MANHVNSSHLDNSAQTGQPQKRGDLSNCDCGAALEQKISNQRSQVLMEYPVKKPKNTSSQKNVIFYQSDESSGASPQEGGGEEKGGGQQGRRQQQDGERPHLNEGESYDKI